ncbi:MAG: hypothetical protein PHE55_21555 [Methylococcaceae bacterium]|nr:hypothetical protein [Methylococcaceae bacterium]
MPLASIGQWGAVRRTTFAIGCSPGWIRVPLKVMLMATVRDSAAIARSIGQGESARAGPVAAIVLNGIIVRLDVPVAGWIIPINILPSTCMILLIICNLLRIITIKLLMIYILLRVINVKLLIICILLRIITIKLLMIYILLRIITIKPLIIRILLRVITIKLLIICIFLQVIYVNPLIICILLQVIYVNPLIICILLRVTTVKPLSVYLRRIDGVRHCSDILLSTPTMTLVKSGIAFHPSGASPIEAGAALLKIIAIAEQRMTRLGCRDERRHLMDDGRRRAGLPRMGNEQREWNSHELPSSFPGRDKEIRSLLISYVSAAFTEITKKPTTFAVGLYRYFPDKGSIKGRNSVGVHAQAWLLTESGGMSLGISIRRLSERGAFSSREESNSHILAFIDYLIQILAKKKARY